MTLSNKEQEIKHDHVQNNDLTILGLGRMKNILCRVKVVRYLSLWKKAITGSTATLLN